jgi:predicted PurR-regulated permease PerM
MTKKYPFYFKSTVVLFGLILFTYALFNLREILVPLAFSVLLAILLNPLTSWLQSKKIPHVVAISISILLAILVLGGILYFISSQLANFQSEMPLLKKKFGDFLVQAQQWVKQYFKISMKQQQQYISNAESSIRPIIASTLGDVLGSLTATFLLPVYTFLLLFYKKVILNFLFEVFEDEDPKEVGIIIKQTKGAIQGYMVGLLLEGLIVATLNSVALLLLDIKYAILLGVIGAILNVLPFIGGILAIIFPLIIATVTKDGVQSQILIVVAYLIIQFIDNHYLVPVIVSSRVKINALVPFGEWPVCSCLFLLSA